MYIFFTEVLRGKEVALWAIKAAVAFLKVRFWSTVIHRLDLRAREGWGWRGFKDACQMSERTGDQASSA